MKGMMWIAIVWGSWAIGGEPTQADIERLLPGKWRITDQADGATMEVTTTYGADHSYHLAGVIKTGSRDLNFDATGTWSVQGNQVTITVASTSHPDVIPVGLAETESFQAIDSKSMTYTDKDGEQATETRVE